MQNFEPILTVSEVAKRLRVCVDTVRRMLRMKRLKGHHVGTGRGDWRILERDLRKYQDQ